MGKEENQDCYIISGNYNKAMIFAKRAFALESKITHISSPEDLVGENGNGKNIYILMAFRNSRNSKYYRECTTMARTRGFNIVFID